MNIGYARVSTTDQNIDLQLNSLNKAGCKLIYQEKSSGANKERIELNNCLKSLREGDTLTVWRLDRLGRNQRHLVEIVTELKEKGINFKSLTEEIDTASATGKLIFHIFSSLAEFERNLTRERIQAGLEAAKKKGKKFGRPNSLTKKQKDLVMNMYQGGATKIDIANHFDVTRQTIYTVIKTHDS